MKCTNEEINYKIGEMFLDDSRSYLARYHQLLENATERGRRCKLLVDIRFAIECALKALIFFESNDDEKKTYQRVKKLGHKLEDLFKDPSVSCDSDIMACYPDVQKLNLDDYDVFLRYSLEAFIEFGAEADQSEYYEMVNNLMNNNTIFDIANKITDAVEKKHFKPIEVNIFADLDVEKLEECNNRIKNIRVK